MRSKLVLMVSTGVVVYFLSKRVLSLLIEMALIRQQAADLSNGAGRESSMTEDKGCREVDEALSKQAIGWL